MMESFNKLSNFCRTEFKRDCFVQDKSILIRSACEDVVPVLAQRFGKFARCWINDPPYGTTLNEWDNVIHADDYWDMAESITSSDAPMIVFGSQPFTSAMVMSAVNWHRYCLVWSKNKCGSPGLAKYRPMKTHEDVMVFSRKTHPYYPQMEEGKPFYRILESKMRQNNHKYGFKNRLETNNTGTRYPKSILEFPRNFSAQQQIHPTQKPTNLLRWLLLSYTQPKDVVIDITAGSFSVAATAWELDQPCICIERDRKFYKTGIAWLKGLKRGNWDPNAYRKQRDGL